MVHVPLPFLRYAIQENAATFHQVLGTNLNELGDGYWLSAWHGEFPYPPGSGQSFFRENLHLRLAGDGTPVGSNDGLTFFPYEEYAPGEIWAPGEYIGTAAVPDGSLIVTDAATPADQTRHAARLLPGGDLDPDWSMRVRGRVVVLSAEVGAVLSRVQEGGAGDYHMEVQLFNIADGSIRNGGIRPFGDWLSLADTITQRGLVARSEIVLGRDGKIYVWSHVKDLPAGGGGFGGNLLITRLAFDGQSLQHDDTFGTSSLPGQTTPAQFVPAPEAGGQIRQVDFVGATPAGRVWLDRSRVYAPSQPDLQVPRAYALLNPDGSLDTGFGEGGYLPVALAAGSDFAFEIGDHPPVSILLGHYSQSSYVLADGSLVGIGYVSSDAALDPNAAVLGVVGLSPDGSWDARIAGTDSPEGAGRTALVMPVDLGFDFERLEYYGGTYAFIDSQDRLVLQANTVAVTDQELPTGFPVAESYLTVARFLLGMIETQVLQEDGQQVLRVTGTGGNDRILLQMNGGMIRLLSGPAGAESIVAEHDPAELDRVEVLGGDGDDLIGNEMGAAFAGFVTLFGGAGNDTLIATGRYDRLYGEAGNDLLTAEGDQDVLMYGGAGNDTLMGGTGRNALWGGPGNDSLVSGPGDDYLDGGEGNDSLLSGAGNDTLIGGVGSNSLVGGDGRDLVWYRDQTQGVTVNLAQGFGRVGPGSGHPQDLLMQIQDVLGGDGDDRITGDDGPNLLIGFGGNNTLLGMGGKDTLIGGTGSNLLDGGDDWDLLLSRHALPGASPGLFTDTLIGGGGFDIALARADDDVDGVQRVANNLEELLALLA